MTDNEDPKKGRKGKGTSKVVCGYPLSIFFIVVNEFCERFSYYGMRAVLVLYLKYFLGWDSDLATSIYHVFVALCYLTPILGAIVADSWLGKFKTIIYLSIVYALGQVAMAVSAVQDITDTDNDGKPNNMTFHVSMAMVGLFLIALGTGGIKPCVAAFGGDQFNEKQDKQRRTFFSVFYLCINGGSLLSTIITPIIRAQSCGSQEECYSLAFGVPAALMVVALVVFIAGSPMYYKAEPQGNIMLDVCKCIGFAIKNRFRHRSKQHPKREHWMDWAEEKYDKLLIAQIKMVLKVLFLYIPLPMFWTLFDQKGSRWTLQATTMDGNFGILVVQPDQMQTFNPILILTLVPLMDSVIYPLIQKCFNFTGIAYSQDIANAYKYSKNSVEKIDTTLDFNRPLKRMTVGMVMAAIAFVCAAVTQIQIDKTLPTFPSASQTQLKLLNMGANPVTVNLSGNYKDVLPAGQANSDFFLYDTGNITVTIGNLTNNLSLSAGERQTLLIPANLNEEWLLTDDLIAKPEKGRNAIRFVNGMNMPVNVTTPDATFGIIESSYYSNYTLVKSGKNTFTIQSGEQKCEFSRDYGFGSSYSYLIPSSFSFGANCHESITEVEYIKPNSAHMALQIPQYFFITAGEVMFSVTGLEFSYSQAPNNMKAVLQAGWLLTVAVGNFIVLIVAELAKIPEQWAEYILFASLLIAVCVIFSIMAHFYTYMDPAEIEAQFTKKADDDDEDDKSELKRTEIEMVKRDSVKSHDDDDSDKESKK